MLRLNKTEWLLLVLFASLLVFPLQYLCRSLDMSTLTSWRWVFVDKVPVRIFFILLPAVLLALPLSSSDLPEKYPVGFLFVLSVLSVLPFINSPEVLIDAARYFLQAKYLSEYGVAEFFRQWGKEITPWTDLPLVPMIYGILFKLFGESKQVIVYFNVLLFGFIPLLTYGIGCLLWDRSTGYLAGLLIMASPYLLTQVPLMLVDVHTMFFLLLAVYTFLYALERGGYLWLSGAGLAIILALLSKFSTWPMLGVLPIIVFIRMGAQPAIVIKRSLAVAVIAGLLMGIIFYWKGEVILQQVDFLRTYQLVGLKKWQEGYLSAFIFQSHPYLALAALFGCWRAVANLDRKMLFMAWFTGLAFFLELKRLRYLLPLLPFFTLTAAYGLQLIPHARVKRYIAYCAVLSSMVIGIWIYKPFLAGTGMSNLQQAGRFLDSLPSEAVEVFCLPQVNSYGNTAVAVPILDLYTDKVIYQAQEWNTEEGLQRARNVSLRFTWELNQPSYYRDREYAVQKLPLVIISGAPINRLPSELTDRYPNAKLVRKFTNTANVFRYQTFVTVFDTL